MEARFFDSQGYKLFGISHIPHIRGGKAKTGVILCHPYGEEKQMSYRVFVRFARELCKDGFYVLRFDARGYGDSEGGFEEATPETQILDTRKAIDFMQQQFGIDRICLLGFRLGGTIAALTAEEDTRVEQLILWCPVIRGRDFLDEMFRKKMYAALAGDFETATPEDMVADIKTNGFIEVEGHLLTKDTYEQLVQIDLISQVSHFDKSVFVCSNKSDSDGRKLHDALVAAYRQHGAACTFEIINERDFYDKQALFGWFFPEQLFEVTKTWLRTTNRSR